jgi:general secretion pathway protein G
LIELLAVMAIVATLASIVIGVGRYTNDTAKVARAKAELAGIAAAVEKYRAKYGDYPQTFESPVMLQSLIGKRGPNGAAIADIALIEVDRFTTQEETNPAGRSDVSLCDPWGSPYQYRYKSAVAGSSFGFVLYSSGPDQAATADARGRFDPLLPENADNIYANQ